MGKITYSPLIAKIYDWYYNSNPKKYSKPLIIFSFFVLLGLGLTIADDIYHSDIPSQIGSYYNFTKGIATRNITCEDGTCEILSNINLTNKNLNSLDNLSITWNATILKDLLVGRNIIIGGNGSVSWNWTITKDLLVGRNIQVIGNASISENLTITKDILVGQDLKVNRNSVISGNGTVSENLTVTQHLLVNGNSNLDNVTCYNQTINKNLVVTGVSYLDNATCSNLTVNKNLVVVNNASFSQDVLISGQTYAEQRKGLNGTYNCKTPPNITFVGGIPVAIVC